MNNKTLWKKASALIMTLILAAGLISGCGKKQGLDPGKAARDAMEKIKDAGDTEEEPGEDTEAEEPSEEEEPTEEASVDPDSLIKGFLEGGVPAEIKSGYIDEGNSIDMNLPSGKSVYIDDITNQMSYDSYEGEMNEDITIDGVSYGKLEVTNAPGDWYCVDISFNSMGEGNMYHIVQALEGRLYICGAFESLYRTAASVNKYGVAESGGSGGAGSYVNSVYVPDKNGDYQHLHTQFFNYPGWDHYEGDRPAEAVNQFMARMDAKYGNDNDMLEDTCVIQTQIGDKYYYSVDTENESVLHDLEDMAKECGALLTPMKDVKEMIEELAAEYGVDAKSLEDDSDLSSYVTEELPYDASYFSARVYTSPGSEKWNDLGRKSDVPFAKNPKNYNSRACFVTDNYGATVTLEEGEWIQSAGEEYDFFHPTNECFTFRPEKDVPYEFGVYETEGIPATRLRVYYRGYVGIHYFTADGRDPEEGGGVSEILYEPERDEAPGRDDPIITLAKVYAGMLVNEGDMYTLNDGPGYWRTLSNAVALLQTETVRAEAEGVRMPKWLLAYYAEAMGMWVLDYRDISDEDPVTYFEDEETYLIRPMIMYNTDDVELLDIRKDESGTYTLSFNVKGQIDRKVDVHVGSVKNIDDPFGWKILTAGFADDATE